MHTLRSADESRPVSFLAQKMKRMSAGGDPQEMMATVREYLLSERASHSEQIYEHTAPTAQVIPLARMRSL